MVWFYNQRIGDGEVVGERYRERLRERDAFTPYAKERTNSLSRSS